MSLLCDSDKATPNETLVSRPPIIAKRMRIEEASRSSSDFRIVQYQYRIVLLYTNSSQ